jgi:hypothetical protein
MMNDNNILQSLSFCECLNEDQISDAGFQTTASVSNDESIYWLRSEIDRGDFFGFQLLITCCFDTEKCFDRDTKVNARNCLVYQ